MSKVYIFCLGVGVALLWSFSMSPNKVKELNLNEMDKKEETSKSKLPLGVFSVSLNVKDINVSKKFYESLGFVQMGGDLKMNYLIMKNEQTIIGLFQGMFQNNILTFNPGWDENGENTDSFVDIREIQKKLKEDGLKLDMEADLTTKGPASVMLKDPDGNTILIDQHR